MVQAYWKPIYTYMRRHWNADHDLARDLTQGFLSEWMERDLLARFDPKRAALRTYIRLCVDGHVLNDRKASGRLKRGGQVMTLSLDFDVAEAELARSSAAYGDPEEGFRREWTRMLFSSAVESLRSELTSEGRDNWFLAFHRYDIEDAPPQGKLTYARLAEDLGLPITQVTNILAAVRRRFRGHVLAELRRLTSGDDEFQEESRRLFGDDRA